MKEFLVKLCTHEHGHLLVLSIFNMYDDTVTLNKFMLSGIVASLDEIAPNEWGRKVISWITASGDSTLFHPKLIQTLEEYQKFGKKDKDVRRKEISNYVLEQIVKSINEKAEFWLSNGSIGLLTVSIVKNGRKQRLTN
jgi:pumilio family protein 6